MTLVARYGADAPFVGGLGARVATAANAAYLAPTVYLIFALSNVGIDKLMIWAGMAATRVRTPALQGVAAALNSAFRIHTS